MRRDRFPTLISNNMRNPLELIAATVEVAGEDESESGVGKLGAWFVLDCFNRR